MTMGMAAADRGGNHPDRWWKRTLTCHTNNWPQRAKLAGAKMALAEPEWSSALSIKSTAL